MSSKINEKGVTEIFLKKWNYKNTTSYIIDDEYLNNRKDWDEPDIKIRSKNNPSISIDIEVTYASDDSLLELHERACKKAIDLIKKTVKKTIPNYKNGFSISINEEFAWNKNFLLSDLKKFKKDLKSFIGTDKNYIQLNKSSYKVINKIMVIPDYYFPVLLLNKRKDEYNYLSYFERLKNALEKEKNSLINKNKKVTKTILLIEINDNIENEVKYAQIAKNEIEHYCYFVKDYQSLYKNIFIIETSIPGRVFNIKDIEYETHMSLPSRY